MRLFISSKRNIKVRNAQHKSYTQSIQVLSARCKWSFKMHFICWWMVHHS